MANITKKEKPLDILAKYHITLEQEMFCQYFTSPTEFFGNGVQSYAAAYGLDLTSPRGYNTAKSRASQLLTNINITHRIDSLLDISGFNEANVDKQLLMIIQQSADWHAKLGGIKEFNKLRQRITERVEHLNAPVVKIEITDAPNRIHEQAEVIDQNPQLEGDSETEASA